MLLITCLSWNNWASGAVVYLKSGGKPVYGFIEQETGTQILMRSLEGGELKDRVIPLSEVEFVLRTVQTERLEKLVPSQPAAYRDYAEELSVKRADPEAREVSIRLFLITANLDDDNLRASALRSLIALARNPEEKRRFQALAFRLGVRKSFGNKNLSLGDAQLQITDRQRLTLVQLMRAWRLGSTNRANMLLKREPFDELFAENDFGITYAEFESIIRKSQVKGSDLGKLLVLELKLTAPKTASKQKEKKVDWGEMVSSGMTEPITHIGLETVTEFNPNECYFRNGKWTTDAD